MLSCVFTGWLKKTPYDILLFLQLQGPWHTAASPISHTTVLNRIPELQDKCPSVLNKYRGIETLSDLTSPMTLEPVRVSGRHPWQISEVAYHYTRWYKTDRKPTDMKQNTNNHNVAKLQAPGGGCPPWP